VFGGKYMMDCRKEFPGLVWRTKGWIYHEDPRGWFQWCCRHYMGCRFADDARQRQALLHWA
jgi:hypothetical protein